MEFIITSFILGSMICTIIFLLYIILTEIPEVIFLLILSTFIGTIFIKIFNI